jgi:hypothetical protein
MTQFVLDSRLSVVYGSSRYNQSALSIEWMKDGEVHDPNGQKPLLLLLFLLF